MKLEFKRDGSDLTMEYYPEFGDSDALLRNLQDGGNRHIRGCFYVTGKLLIKSPFSSDDSLFSRVESDEDSFDGSLYFRIGTVEEHYTKIDSDVIGTKNDFYFSNDIELSQEMFVAHRNISILRKLDTIINTDVYIGIKSDSGCYIPVEVFDELIRKFPRTAELNHYANAKIASIIKEYFGDAETYEMRFQKFLNRRKVSSNISGAQENFGQYSRSIELAQFRLVRDELNQLLDTEAGTAEEVWQKKIFDILQLFYPKYIASVSKLRLDGVDGYTKEPDFLLVDANGYVDVMEIKRPGVQLMTKQVAHRNNYVPMREFAGAVQQIEKYIYCLKHHSEKTERRLQEKLLHTLPDGIVPKVLNPQGILLLGRSAEFKGQQQADFELVKRQYKNIVDIMTYDDLVSRIDTIVKALERKLPNSESDLNDELGSSKSS